MKACKDCSFITSKDNINTCPHCHSDLVSFDSLNKEQASELSDKLHSNDVKEYDKGQNSLCFVVLGIISLIIGGLFIVLSLQRRRNKIVGINYQSLAFVICIVTLILGFILLIWGLVKYFNAHLKRKEYKKAIETLASLKK